MNQSVVSFFRPVYVRKLLSLDGIKLFFFCMEIVICKSCFNKQQTNEKKRKERSAQNEHPWWLNLTIETNFELQLYKGNTYVERVCKMRPSN